MDSVRSSVVSRASRASSSLAVTLAMAVLTILALAMGTVQDSKAETNSGSMLGATKVEDPTLVWGKMATGSLPERSMASKSATISREPLSLTNRGPSAPRSPQGPTHEWMGMSKLAFPLLVGDLTGGQAVQAPRLMTGRTVGVVK